MNNSKQRIQADFADPSQTSLTAQESASLTPLFNLTDRLQIFTYLVSTNRVRWYRVIMRNFLQSHREFYRYQLTAKEIRDVVRTAFDPDYTLDQCQSDLAVLKEWGNVTTIYDPSRATSIASFLTPALLYQATPAAIAVETFLDEQIRASATRGSLRQGDLPRLWASLEQLDVELERPLLEVSVAEEREVAEEWRRAFEIWDAIAREAAQYLATMINAAQQDRFDLQAYQAYKSAVVEYVHGFAQTLTVYSRRIRELLLEWSKAGKQERLIQLVSQYLDPPSPTTENRRTPEERYQEASNQFAALSAWFAQGSNADSFRRNALAEVDKVVRRASTLAATARPNANYATSLNALALDLLSMPDGEAAQQLFSIAFANTLPVHLPESLAGVPSTANDGNKGTSWQEPASVTLRLRPVGHAVRGDALLESAIADHTDAARELVLQHAARLQEQRQRFARLFANTELDIGNIGNISEEDRAVLTEVIDRCMEDPRHQYRIPGGSTIILTNPEEKNYAFLRASDGVLILPRYRLQRQERDGTAA